MSCRFRVTVVVLFLGTFLGSFASAAEQPPVQMKQFVLGLLYKGSAWKQSATDEAQRLQSAHMENINRLVDNGSMAVAGPVDSTGDLRGLFIFNVDTIEKAKALIATDPAVTAGQLRFELHVWYGPAAITDVVSRSRRSAGEKR